jgi:D-alanyl-D-alanine carboxypeptidase/D-alanyl-D-alanine-endopeptidase (penicillin-binding protein 4)
MTDQNKFRNSGTLALSIVALLIFSSCSSSKVATTDKGTPKTEVNLSAGKELSVMMDTSRVFNKIFTGFALYDPKSDNMLFSQYGDRYFTPASNTKILTFYSGLKLLPENLPALEYVVENDTLWFWGTGDPTFLHPDYDNGVVFEFLKNRTETLVYSDAHFRDELLGSGWSWADLNYYYSAEKSSFPVYGNVMRVKVERITQERIAPILPNGDELDISPRYFNKLIEKAPSDKNRPLIERELGSTEFIYQPKSDTTSFTTDKPFHYTPELMVDLLADTLGREVVYQQKAKPSSNETTILRAANADSVYRAMMYPSDNHIAEQILLMISAEMGDDVPMNTRAVINYVKENLFNDLPDEVQWVDGSGLSRYNMITPRSMIQILKKIDDEFEETEDEKLLSFFPAGGERGTISYWYGHRDGGKPYVYAKTGTLSNNHCLSGFVITESGKKLYFSFMNNHYTGPSSQIKTEMEKMLWHIYKNY